jgi:hypothetical protein
MANVTIAINNSSTDSPYGTSGVSWVDVSLGNDSLIFSNGSDTVADGEVIPSESDYIQAGVVLTGAEQIVPHYFLADVSESELKEIFLAGNQNKRYVFAVDFDAATASEPVLEIWDDATFLTIDSTSLGAGTASNSWWRGITTTSGLPGTDWAGTILAGSSANHFLYLNNGSGALTVATTLYFNLKIVIPASATTGGSGTPKIVIKYTSN